MKKMTYFLSLLASFLFIPAAYAVSEQPNTILSFLPLIVIVAVFYFLVIRPQQKKQKVHKKMIEDLKAGDEVLSSNGIYGKIIKLHTNYLDLEIAKSTQVKLQKSAIVQVMPKGTLENLD